MEQINQAARKAAARALIDTPFLADPEVVRLKAQYEALRGVQAYQPVIRRFLQAEQLKQTARVDSAQNALKWEALFDAAANDLNFSRARVAMSELIAERELQDAILKAISVVDCSPDSAHELHDAVENSRTALNERLFELKLAQVDSEHSHSQETP
ncbi:hypothetical protein [Ottowia thiooxydans]|uniref:hypothetical protein n=1 Tax=Ottowia thiooxydans TaxID=219182 RepID=UPI000420620F|nr:hypothetical protein [Ottowia thiooxydans]